MNVLQRVQKLWQLTDGEHTGVITTIIEHKDAFVTFPCAECNQPITIERFIYPGDAAVINCDNCDTSMTVFSPALIIKRTKDLPKGVQEKVWGELSA